MTTTTRGRQSHAEWDTFLGKKQSRKITHNTWANRIGKEIHVVYHKTSVVIYKGDGRIELNSGGWKTATTKNRINRYSPAQVWQVTKKKGDDPTWYISHVSLNADGEFEDGIEFYEETQRKEVANG